MLSHAMEDETMERGAETGPVDRDRMYVRTHLFRAAPGAAWTEGEAQPRELLLAALGACTLRAITAHARGRAWELGEITVDVSHVDDEDVMRIGRLVQVDASLDAEQREELVRACDDTPVTRAFGGSARITTVVLPCVSDSPGASSGAGGGP